MVDELTSSEDILADQTDKSIHELPAASTIGKADLFVIEQDGEAKQASGQLIVSMAEAAGENAAAQVAAEFVGNLPELTQKAQDAAAEAKSYANIAQTAATSANVGIGQLQRDVYGYQRESVTLEPITWTIAEPDTTTGVLKPDSQNMRITSNLIAAPEGTVIDLSGTGSCYYDIFFYDADGAYQKCNQSWTSVAMPITSPGGKLRIKVRWGDWSTWDTEKIVAFSAKVVVTTPGSAWVPGLTERVAALEQGQSIPEDVEALREVLDGTEETPGLIARVATLEQESQGFQQVQQLQRDVYGYQRESVTLEPITWTIAEPDTATGVLKPDSQNMRITSSLIAAPEGTVIDLSGVGSCYYVVFFYDADGTYQKCDQSWSPVSTPIICTSGKMRIKVRWSNYAAWDDAKIASFAQNMEVTTPGSAWVPGLTGRVEALEAEGADVEALQAAVETNATEMAAIRETLKTYSGGSGGTTVIVQSGELNEALSLAETAEQNATIATLQNLTSPETAVIAWFTDPHITANELTTTEETVRTYSSGIRKHVTMLNHIADVVDIDLIAWGGDYLNNTKNTLKAGAVLSYGVLRGYLKGVRQSIPQFVLTGNHDDNSLNARENGKNAEQWIPEKERWQLLHGLHASDAVRDPGRMGRTYGYYDIPNRQIRVFFLNTADLPVQVGSDGKLNYLQQNDTGFRQEQLAFVAKNLLFEEAGWQVLFLSHHPLTVNTSVENNVGVTALRGGDSMRQIIKAFANKTAGTATCTTEDFESSISYDFTQNASNTVVACVCGHTHTDATAAFGGIQVIATKAVLEGNSVYLVIDREGGKLHVVCNSATADEAHAGADITYDY